MDKASCNVTASGDQVIPDRESCSPAFSITVRIQIANRPGQFASVLQAIAAGGGSIGEITLLSSTFAYTLRDVTIAARSEEHSRSIVELLARLSSCSLVGWQDDTMVLHEGGKLSVALRHPLVMADDLSRLYTPGVARVCTAIANDPDSAYIHTVKGNAVAVITDGTAVLGLGDLGPTAAMPVMEGKAVLFKKFANIDAYPICLDSKDPDEIVKAIKMISPGFGGINLEDISAPRCFEIEQRLNEELDIPVFHDDQHGTAVVVLAALMNAAKLVGKKFCDLRVVISGFGAGGVACTQLLAHAGIKNIIPCDTNGIVYRGRPQGMNPVKEKIIQYTNPDNVRGTIADALHGADVFIGVSKPGGVTAGMIKHMAPDPIVFALANPVPELLPHELKGIARIIATGRSDYANQVNNVLCFPGIFRGALDCHAREITQGMKMAAAEAIASCVSPAALTETNIIPGVFDPAVTPRVAQMVIDAAVRDGVARSRVRASNRLQDAHVPVVG